MWTCTESQSLSSHPTGERWHLHLSRMEGRDPGQHLYGALPNCGHTECDGTLHLILSRWKIYLPSQPCPALRLGERVVLSSPLGRVWNGPKAARSRGLEEGEVGYSRRRPWESSHTSFLKEKCYGAIVMVLRRIAFFSRLPPPSGHFWEVLFHFIYFKKVLMLTFLSHHLCFLL